MSEPGERKESLFSRLKPLLWIVLPIAGGALALCGPDLACERITSSHWGLKGARILPGPDPGTLLLHLRSQGRQRQKSFEKLLAVQLDSGQQVGSYLTSNRLKPFGLGADLLWVRQSKLREKRWTAYSLPGLEQRHELRELLRAQRRVAWPVGEVRFDPISEQLVLRDKHQRWFELEPGTGTLASQDEPGPASMPTNPLQLGYCEYPPSPPRAVDDELLLDGVFVCDGSNETLLELGGGDRLVAYQDLERDTGKLILGRLTAENRWAWRFTEQQRFGARPREVHGYRVAFAAQPAEQIVLVLQQAEANADLRVVAIDPDDGTLVWQHRIE